MFRNEPQARLEEIQADRRRALSSRRIATNPGAHRRNSRAASARLRPDPHLRPPYRPGPRPSRASPMRSSPNRGHSPFIRVPGAGTRLRIAIGWMMCHDRHPPPRPPSCLSEKPRCRPLAGSGRSTRDPCTLPAASGPLSMKRRGEHRPGAPRVLRSSATPDRCGCSRRAAYGRKGRMNTESGGISRARHGWSRSRRSNSMSTPSRYASRSSGGTPLQPPASIAVCSSATM